MSERAPVVDLTSAIERADKARAAIASIVDSVRSESIDLPQAFILADGDVLVGRCFAVKVFEVVPGIGKVRARRTMAQLGLAEDVWLRDVPEKQRSEILVAFTAA